MSSSPPGASQRAAGTAAPHKRRTTAVKTEDPSQAPGAADSSRSRDWFADENDLSSDTSSNSSSPPTVLPTSHSPSISQTGSQILLAPTAAHHQLQSLAALQAASGMAVPNATSVPPELSQHLQEPSALAPHPAGSQVTISQPPPPLGSATSGASNMMGPPASAIHSSIAERIQRTAVQQRPAADFGAMLPTRPDQRNRPMNENQKRVAELSDSFEQYLRLMEVPPDSQVPGSGYQSSLGLPFQMHLTSPSSLGGPLPGHGAHTAVSAAGGHDTPLPHSTNALPSSSGAPPGGPPQAPYQTVELTSSQLRALLPLSDMMDGAATSAQQTSSTSPHRTQQQQQLLQSPHAPGSAAAKQMPPPAAVVSATSKQQHRRSLPNPLISDITRRIEESGAQQQFQQQQQPQHLPPHLQQPPPQQQQQMLQQQQQYLQQLIQQQNQQLWHYQMQAHQAQQVIFQQQQQQQLQQSQHTANPFPGLTPSQQQQKLAELQQLHSRLQDQMGAITSQMQWLQQQVPSSLSAPPPTASSSSSSSTTKPIIMPPPLYPASSSPHTSSASSAALSSIPAAPAAAASSSSSSAHPSSMSSSSAPPPAGPVDPNMPRLVISEQPTPKSLWKQRRIQPPFSVRLLAPPGVVKARGPVQAYLVTDSPDRIDLVNAVEQLSDDGSATLARLQFTKGSHQHLSHLYFETHVTLADGRQVTVTTPPSEPFIICTNINQWVASEKRIFKKICFGEESQVTWDQFAHVLQAHFVRALGCVRPLSLVDLSVIYHRIGARLAVTPNALNDFWDWYGPVLKEIYEKNGHWRSIWERFLVYGFVTPMHAAQLLAGTEVGTFLVSFSDRRGGELAIYYVANTAPPSVKEYTMSAEEQKQAFRDFLLHTQCLGTLICPPRPVNATGILKFDPNEPLPPLLRGEIMTKTRLLREFRSSRSSSATTAQPAAVSQPATPLDQAAAAQYQQQQQIQQQQMLQAQAYQQQMHMAGLQAQNPVPLQHPNAYDDGSGGHAPQGHGAADPRR